MTRLLQYRSYVVHNAVDELRHRYAGTSLGLVWNLFIPLAQIAVYTVVFTKVMVVQMPPGAHQGSFVLYLCAGFLPWIAFTETIVRGGQAFLEYAPLLRRLPVPEEAFVAQSALSSMLSLSISLSLLLVAAALLGAPPRLSWLLLPVVGFLFQLFAFGIGLCLSCLVVALRDLAQLLPILLQIWMWLTPIVYVEEILPPVFRSWMSWNPAAPFVRSCQHALLDGQVPSVRTFTVMVAWAAGSVLLGSLVVRRLRGEIRDLV